jgi:hypothetical protein
MTGTVTRNSRVIGSRSIANASSGTTGPQPGPRAGRCAGRSAGRLADACSGSEEVEEIEDLLADAVRLAAQTGATGTAQFLAGHADALAAESDIPHRQANALYCRGLLNRDVPRLLAAAERYDNAGRPLLRAKALEAAAGHFLDGGDRGQAQTVFTQAVDAYTVLGATADIDQLQATFRPHGIRRGPHAKHLYGGTADSPQHMKPCAPRPSLSARLN